MGAGGPCSCGAAKAVLGYDGLSIVGTNGLKRLATRAGRLAHRMVHDSRRDRYVVFGGAVLRGGENPTGLTEYETTLPYLEIDPKQPGYPHVVPTTPSSIPRARVYHDMVYDERPRRDRDVRVASRDRPWLRRTRPCGKPGNFDPSW
jgi:hypothetical protein